MGDTVAEDVGTVARTDETETIHIWQSTRAMCGSTHQAHPECWSADRWPETYGWPPSWTLILCDGCPSCRRPLCTFCQELLRQKVERWVRGTE